MTIGAAAGHSNTITVNVTGATFVISDSGDTVIPGFGCGTVNANMVSCSTTSVATVVVDADDLNDIITANVSASTSALLFGGPGDDTVNGGRGADMLSGGAGNDVLSGRAGNDMASYSAGGTSDGADVFSGGVGTDTASYGLRAGAHNVSLDGVANDGLSGEGDNNRTDVENIIGGASSDFLTGNSSMNFLQGGFGNDVLNGLAGSDRLRGEGGADRLSGGVGFDSLDGGDGNDRLRGGGDGDFLVGGPGPISDPDGTIRDNDILDGGLGDDTATYFARTTPVRVDLDGHADDGRPGSGEKDNVMTNVENIVGGKASDTLIGNGVRNRVFGGSGNDTILGLAGNDFLSGSTGNDTLVAGVGDDAIQGVAGNDRLTGGPGSDAISGGDGTDKLFGFDGVGGNDKLNGGSSTDTCTADLGDSKISCEV